MRAERSQESWFDLTYMHMGASIMANIFAFNTCQASVCSSVLCLVTTMIWGGGH